MNIAIVNRTLPLFDHLVLFFKWYCHSISRKVRFGSCSGNTNFFPFWKSQRVMVEVSDVKNVGCVMLFSSKCLKCKKCVAIGMWIGDLWNWFTVNSWWYSNLLQDCSCLPWYSGYFWIHLTLFPLFLWIHVPGYQPQLDAWNGISRTAAGSSYEYVQTISGWLLYILYST